MRKRNQILKTNILAQMLYERQKEKVDRLYAFTYAYTSAFTFTYTYAYTYAYTSAYASAYTSASASASYTFTSAEWKQISRSGPDQIMLIVEGIKLL